MTNLQYILFKATDNDIAVLFSQIAGYNFFILTRVSPMKYILFCTIIYMNVELIKRMIKSIILYDTLTDFCRYNTMKKNGNV